MNHEHEREKFIERWLASPPAWVATASRPARNYALDAWSRLRNPGNSERVAAAFELSKREYEMYMGPQMPQEFYDVFNDPNE